LYVDRNKYKVKFVAVISNFEPAVFIKAKHCTMGSALSNCKIEDSSIPNSSSSDSHSQSSRPPSRRTAHFRSTTGDRSVLREWDVKDSKIEKENQSRSSYYQEEQRKLLMEEERPSTISGTSVRFHPHFVTTNSAAGKRSVYFRNYTHGKGVLYTFAILYVVSCSIVSILQPLLVNCQEIAAVSDFENPGYAFTQSCHHRRNKYLLFLTPQECTFGRRIVFAALFGAMIGWERRQADRPAGIRTMSLVSLGACLFSICGTFAFIDGPMGWDASRVSAAIPSGVGFLGAGIIWKQTDKESNAQSVHGLTTAASLWLSAAVGIACSGELYFAASFSIAVMMILLRFGPRIIIGREEAHHFSSERDFDVESQSSSLPSEFLGPSVRRYNSVDSLDSTVKSPNKKLKKSSMRKLVTPSSMSPDTPSIME
jgi:putative Mg2+ transporter-C (MgtC) family protein